MSASLPNANLPNANHAPPRYSPRPLPPYRYVSGQTPHPVSNPAGHMFGEQAAASEPLTDANWEQHDTWLYAADLFNHGFYWEAHEAWESLWHAAGRQGPEAELFQGLIKLAAAGVKLCEGRPAGVQRHTARAAELLTPYANDTRFGLRLATVLAATHEIQRDDAPRGDRLPLILRLDVAVS
jgi:hypothetical protein